MAGETQRGHYDVEQESAGDQHPEHGHGAGGPDVQELPVQCALPPRRCVSAPDSSERIESDVVCSNQWAEGSCVNGRFLGLFYACCGRSLLGRGRLVLCCCDRRAPRQRTAQHKQRAVVVVSIPRPVTITWRTCPSKLGAPECTMSQSRSTRAETVHGPPRREGGTAPGSTSQPAPERPVLTRPICHDGRLPSCTLHSRLPPWPRPPPPRRRCPLGATRPNRLQHGCGASRSRPLRASGR